MRVLFSVCQQSWNEGEKQIMQRGDPDQMEDWIEVMIQLEAIH